MSEASDFFDTKVLLYLLAKDAAEPLRDVPNRFRQTQAL